MAIAFYIKGAEGRVEGPFSAQTLKKKASQGEISDSTGIRKGTDGPWIPARRVGGLLNSGPREEPASPLRLGATPAPDAPQPPVLFTPTDTESQDDEFPLLEEDLAAPVANSLGDTGFEVGPSTWSPSATPANARHASNTDDFSESSQRSTSAEKICLVVSVLGGVTALAAAGLGSVGLILALLGSSFIASLPMIGLTTTVAICAGLLTVVTSLAARTLIQGQLATASLRCQQLAVLQSVEQRLADLLTSHAAARTDVDDSSADPPNTEEISEAAAGGGR